MYGTIARLQLKPGSDARFSDLMRTYEELSVPGYIGTSVYRMDSSPNECWLVVAFENRDSYFANARSAEQDARYRDLRQLLETDPEWHDGEIMYSFWQGRRDDTTAWSSRDYGTSTEQPQ